jgi:hypothetical protein
MPCIIVKSCKHAGMYLPKARMRDFENGRQSYSRAGAVNCYRTIDASCSYPPATVHVMSCMSSCPSYPHELLGSTCLTLCTIGLVRGATTVTCRRDDAVVRQVTLGVTSRTV